MPYTPPKLSREDQIRRWFQNHPEDAEKFQRGTLPANYEMPFTQPSAADRQEAYYDENPEGDPQSTVSKYLQMLGLDQPYNEDNRSYDYSQRKWDQSLADGSPNVRYMARPTYDMSLLGKGTMPDLADNDDPRTDNQKWQGKIMDFLDLPTLGHSEEVIAGLQAAGETANNRIRRMFGDNSGQDGDYDKNFKYMEDQELLEGRHVPAWNRAIPTIAALPVAAPAFTGTAAGAGKIIDSGRKLLGYGSKPMSAGYKYGREGASLGAATAATDVAYQHGHDENPYDPTSTAIWGAFPMIGPAAAGASHLIRKGARGVKGFFSKKGKTSDAKPEYPKRRIPNPPEIPPKLAREITGKPKVDDPRPKQPTVRQDIDAALAATARRRAK